MNCPARKYRRARRDSRDNQSGKMDGDYRIQWQSQGGAIDPKDARRLLVDPIAVRQFAISQSPTDISVLAFVALKRDSERRAANSRRK